MIVVALPGAPAAAATGYVREFSYRGSEIRLETGAEPRIVVDGSSVEVVDSNGAYRAAGFMYSPQETPELLAKRLLDYQNQIIPGKL